MYFSGLFFTQKPPIIVIMSTSATFAAFLLGINIGKYKRVPMHELKAMCVGMGFKNVRTLLASGNLVFDAPNRTCNELVRELEAQLKATFGFEVAVIVRALGDLQKMIDAEPFKNVEPTKNTRLYVTFYTEEPKTKISAGLVQDGKGHSFRILAVSEGMVLSTVELGTTGTLDVMNILSKMLGKKITTRNWNTIEKLVRK